VLFPGKFVPRPPSKLEDGLITFAPPQLWALAVLVACNNCL
jgi:hypothetical protein